MKLVTFLNLIQMIVLSIFGALALAGAIFYDASFHYLTAAMCAILSYTIYVDRHYGESVKDYFNRLLKK